MEWIGPAALTAAVGIATAVILIWRFAREKAKDPHLQWLVKGAAIPGEYEISVQPIGGDVRDVRLAIGFLGGHIDHPPLARAEWPTDKRVLSLALSIPIVRADPGRLWVLIVWRSTSHPGLQYEEWFPVALEGEAARLARQQTLRSPLHTWLLRIHGASVSPETDGIPRRRLTKRDIRREIRWRTETAS